MNGLDPLVRDLLDRNFPPTRRAANWDGVLERAASRRWRAVALVVAVLLAVLVPTFALSASVRDLLFPKPVLSKARLMVSTPLGDGRTVRVWESPSDTGGACWFTTADRADTDKRPASIGGGGCSTSRNFHALHGGLPISASVATERPSPHWLPPTVTGWVSPKLHATRVELRSRLGLALRLAFRNDYFVGVSAKLFRPSFDTLPYYVIAYDREGHEVARTKISSYSLYLMQKRALDRTLRPYVRAHPGRHIM